MNKLIFIPIVLCAACKESYDPPVISTNHAYLVVEGFINNGADSTIFTLTRTFRLYDTTKTAPPELNARVSVQGTDNSAYSLTEIGNGKYATDSLALNPSQQYRLTIATSDGKQYQSNYVPLKTSPPIDSLNWTQTSDGVQIYITTHDLQNQSRYYHWNYTETWEFHSIELSYLEYANDTILPRFPLTFYYCWQSDNSNSILIGNSTKLAQDEISQAPLALVPANSWKIGVDYSILAKEYTLTADAYSFWQNLQTNTELIGSLFSPEPSAAKGNLHCITDSTQTVVGYVSAGTVSQARIFIRPEQLSNWVENEYPHDCEPRITTNTADSDTYYFSSGSFIPTEWAPPAPPFLFVFYDYYPCVDCRAIGSNIKPPYWQ